MAHLLKNSNLEIHIDRPLENYNFSRFDWTGKISQVKFRDIPLTTTERMECLNEHQFGKGLYNEFGIDSAIGFDETAIGDWFHKIGVGLLKKVDNAYLFSKEYQIEPPEFEFLAELSRVTISCKSKSVNGYSYLLRKVIQLHESNFSIQYNLENTGSKVINTTEYVHNFFAMNAESIGPDYSLNFPFSLNPQKFDAIVNPDSKVHLGSDEITFNGQPREPFFFSNLTGSKAIDAKWELRNYKSKIAIRETGSFQTNKVNLWGWKHVISPELFIEIYLKPGQSAQWRRNYNVNEII